MRYTFSALATSEPVIGVLRQHLRSGTQGAFGHVSPRISGEGP